MRPEARRAPPEPLLPPARWREQAAYLRGAQLFRRGAFFDAHEEWEGLWAQAPAGGAQRLFLQALIQLAAALLKHERGSRAGSTGVARAARAKLALVAERERLERYMGVDVVALGAAVDAAFAPVFAGAAGAPLPPLAARVELGLARARRRRRD